MFLPRFSFIITLTLSAVAFAFEASGQQQPQQTNPPAATVDRYVTEKGFRGRVFEIKYREPESLRRVLLPLGSGFKGSSIEFSRDLKIVSVRDFPENIAAMEEALKRLDTPEAAQSRPDIELRMHVFIASNGEGASNQHPSELNDVIKQLQSSLNYKSYYLLTSLVQRAREGAGNVRGSGIAEFSSSVTTSGGANAEYSYEIEQVLLSPSLTGSSTVQLNGFRFGISFANTATSIGRADLRTSTGVRDGERVVIGTASLKDKGLIVVLSARVIK
ncbi:MAG TPA: hypothetical protein VM943_09170 [Pyrinomonadaceae bacterium]|nr:hypothetical protein [Pyrinomonadaceae bacterium]